jgi:hypothetical protein
MAVFAVSCRFRHRDLRQTRTLRKQAYLLPLMSVICCLARLCGPRPPTRNADKPGDTIVASGRVYLR